MRDLRKERMSKGINTRQMDQMEETQSDTRCTVVVRGTAGDLLEG